MIKVVTDIKDTSFWKQFTTQLWWFHFYQVLLLISKIPHFESNSQLRMLVIIPDSRCYWYQRYLILKAIHNSLRAFRILDLVVTDIKDTSFWKQFTTVLENYSNDLQLLLISKIPHFESNSQLCQTALLVLIRCYWYQRYLILKAIHNLIRLKIWIDVVVTDIKDTSFWKQFTTCHMMMLPQMQLLLISKIPHFESNSQQHP